MRSSVLARRRRLDAMRGLAPGKVPSRTGGAVDTVIQFTKTDERFDRLPWGKVMIRLSIRFTGAALIALAVQAHAQTPTPADTTAAPRDTVAAAPDTVAAPPSMAAPATTTAAPPTTTTPAPASTPPPASTAPASSSASAT